MQTQEERIKGWEKLIEEAVERQKTRSPKMAREMQAFIQRLEQDEEERGTPLPKHSHRFAPEALWPERYPKDQPSASETSQESNAAASSPTATPSRPRQGR